MAILNENTTIGGIRILDKLNEGGERGKIYGPATTAGSAGAYTLNIKDITSLYSGLMLVVILHIQSNITTPTLNINNLGAKQIAIYNDNNGYTQPATIDAYDANNPLLLIYDGTRFRLINITRATWERIENKPEMVPLSHASTQPTYGVGSSTNYGHVKLQNNLTATTTGSALDATQGKILDDSVVKYGANVGGDLDALRTIGMYSGSFSNGPNGSTEWGSVIVQWSNAPSTNNKPNGSNTPSYVNQIFIKEGNGQKMYFRTTNSDSSWGPWKEIVTTDMLSGGSAIPPGTGNYLNEATGVSLIGQRAAAPAFTAPTGETLLGQLPSSLGSYYVTINYPSTTQIQIKRYDATTHDLYGSAQTITLTKACNEISPLLDYSGYLWFAGVYSNTATDPVAFIKKLTYGSSTASSATIDWTREITGAEYQEWSGSSNTNFSRIKMIGGKDGYLVCSFGYYSSSSSEASNFGYIWRFDGTSSIATPNSWPIYGANITMHIADSGRIYFVIPNNNGIKIDYASSFTSYLQEIFSTSSSYFDPAIFDPKSEWFYSQYLSGSGTSAKYTREFLKLNGGTSVSTTNMSDKYVDRKQEAKLLCYDGNYVIYKIGTTIIIRDESREAVMSGGAGLGLYSVEDNEFVCIFPMCCMYESCRLDYTNNKFYINQGNGKELVYEFTKLPTV